MDKKNNKDLVLKRIVHDKNLNANEIRVILYAMEEGGITSNLVMNLFDCKLPYANQIINKLEKKNYLEKWFKKESSRLYFYRLIDDIAPAQTTIEDF